MTKTTLLILKWRPKWHHIVEQERGVEKLSAPVRQDPANIKTTFDTVRQMLPQRTPVFKSISYNW